MSDFRSKPTFRARAGLNDLRTARQNPDVGWATSDVSSGFVSVNDISVDYSIKDLRLGF
jgi:hypothetical protein